MAANNFVVLLRAFWIGLLSVTLVFLLVKAVPFLLRASAPPDPTVSTTMIANDRIFHPSDDFNRDDQIALIHFAEVRAELKLTPQQEAQIGETLRPRDPGFHHGSYQPPEINKSFSPSLPLLVVIHEKPPAPTGIPQVFHHILNFNQQRRLQQLTLQWHGIESLADPHVCWSLGISLLHHRKIAALVGNESNVPVHQYDKAIRALLTPEEKSRWHSAQGSHFSFRHAPNYINSCPLSWSL